jgi:hypothetical protein
MQSLLQVFWFKARHFPSKSLNPSHASPGSQSGLVIDTLMSIVLIRSPEYFLKQVLKELAVWASPAIIPLIIPKLL